MMQYMRIIGIFLIIVVLGSAGWFFSKIPSNDREWDPAFSKQNTVTINEDSTLTIHNLRTFSYDLGTTTAYTWKDVTINPDDIESTWFFLDHFKPTLPLVGHTFISFRMKDGSAIAFSVEARREADEKYSFVGGFLRQYDLQYLWGTEQDLILQRVVYKNEQLYLFPLAISKEDAVALIKDFAQETNTLAEKPRFYNTFVANCTNLLAKIVNAHHPHTLPYDISWNLTGLADGYLEDEGFIATNGMPRDELRNLHDLTTHRDTLAAHRNDTAAVFSELVRSLIQK